MAKNIINQWDPQFLQRSEIFADLRILLEQQEWNDWPGCSGLMALLDKTVLLGSGLPLKMVPQDDSLPHPQMGYEERIFKTGLISTREQNWHDLFNACIWLLFPQTKIVLNELHLTELAVQTGNKRTSHRDIITHFDESGIVIASTDRSLMELLKNHQWDKVFVHSRTLWWQQIGAFVFGHGLYEKAFNPFIGFTGKAYCIEVTEEFFQLDKMRQFQQLDRLLSDEIKNQQMLFKHRALTPLPILGVPGWYAANKNPQFYHDKNYFREKRK